jgi:fluoride exporter
MLTLMTEQLTTASWLRSALAIGFLGAYTTFSTLQYEAYRLLEDGAVTLAVANVLGSAAAGLLAVYLGVVAGRAV